jgi:hypothetical protein
MSAAAGPISRGLRGALLRLRAHARRVMIEAARELARLNHAGIGREEMARMARRQRTRAVKQALAERHRGRARCC